MLNADTFGRDRPLLPTWFDRNGSPEHDIAPVILFPASQGAQCIAGYSLQPTAWHPTAEWSSTPRVDR